MGWTGYHATYYRNGLVDRKAECDETINSENEKYKWEVLKSSMHGSVYYAAVKRTEKDTGASEVFAVVFLTHTNMKDYYNFTYKDMDETMLPYYFDCPVSILKLLTPTDNENANKWRELCREKQKDEKNISKLPIGTIIEYERNGQKEQAQKMNPAYQFKTAWWKIVGKHQYISKKRIPDSFQIVNATA